MDKTMQMPKVSIIVPVFNMGQFLNRAIDSFLMQTEIDFEVIISDNHSTDRTREIVQQYSDKRIKYYRNESNIGFINNFNAGLKHAQGKYVTMISCDEFMVGKDSLSKRLAILEGGDEVDLVWCDYNLETMKGEIVRWPMIHPSKDILTASEGIQSVYNDTLATNFRITTVIFRRQILDVSNYVLPLVHSADRPMILEWMIRSRNVALVREVLHCSYMHTEHKHDFFGKPHPYMGERDFLMLKFLDDHGPRLIAMGFSIDKLELLALRDLGRVWLKMPKYTYANFNFYGYLIFSRFSKLLLKQFVRIIFIPIYFPLAVIHYLMGILRKFLASIPVVKKIYKYFVSRRAKP